MSAPRPLTVNKRAKGPVTILDLAGRLTLGSGSLALRAAMRDLLGKGRNGLAGVLLDLAKVETLDSAGLGELVAAYSAAETAGVRLALLRVPQRFLPVFRTSRLDHVLTMFEKEEAALETFGG